MPESQKADARPISFVLEEDGAVAGEVTLALRPEDFSRTDTSRSTVHHTLGGAWVDCFGPGLPTITIAGTTGWRGGQDGSGEVRWKKLRDDVWVGWHSKRKAAIQAGKDPSKVNLLYADALSSFVVEVAPMSLTLRRSKSRPLLIQYQMSLTVLDQNADQLKYLQGGTASGTPGEQGGFFASVMGSIARIRAAIASVQNWVNSNLIAPVRNFLAMANSVFTGVLGIVRDVRGLVQSVLAIPMMIAQAGANLFRTLTSIASLPAQIMSDVMGVAGAFTNVMCFLLRSRSAKLTYGDYNAFYGASNCSSISGGRPASVLSGSNPFYALPASTMAVGGTSIAISPQGRAGLTTLANSDPVLRPMNENQIGSNLQDIQAGVTPVRGAPGTAQSQAPAGWTDMAA